MSKIFKIVDFANCLLLIETKNTLNYNLTIFLPIVYCLFFNILIF